MEEILVVIIQVVLEVGLQIFGSIGLDFATSSRGNSPTTEEEGCGWLLAFGVAGGVCGGLSLIPYPKALLPWAGLRIANLIAAPLLAGELSSLAVRYVFTQRSWDPRHHFWRGFWFAMCFGLIRFTYIHR